MNLAERTGIAIYNSNGKRFFEERGLDPRTARLLSTQFMHDVFHIPGASAPGVYVKIAKKGKDGTPDRKEMDIERQWYNTFRNDLALPGAPLAETFPIDGDYALVVEEVPGAGCDEVFRGIAKKHGPIILSWSPEFKSVLERSAEISARGYHLHLENPEKTQVFFRGADGGFDNGEFDFLNGRTLKIMTANGRETKYLAQILAAPKADMTSPEKRALYRDATPLNWISAKEGIVAIDLGSTSYRPPQFELIALLETPGTGIDEISPEVKRNIIQLQRRLLAGHGLDVSPEHVFERDYALASLIKNASGVASRLDHIVKNRAMIASEDPEQQKIGAERLAGNISGKRFHSIRAIEALDNLEKYFSSQGLEEQARMQKDLFAAELDKE